MCTSNLPHNRESQTAAFSFTITHRLRGGTEKALEYLLPFRFIDARAVVLNTEFKTTAAATISISPWWACLC